VIDARRHLIVSFNEFIPILIVFCIYSGIYALLARLVSCYMNMEKKDRLAIFITSFITMIDICFFNFSVMINHTRFFFNNNLTIQEIVSILIPIIVEGTVYKNTLKYKKINGWIVAIITHAIAITVTWIISCYFNLTIFRIWPL